MPKEISQKELPNYIGKEITIEKDGIKNRMEIQSIDDDAVYGVCLDRKDTYFVLILNKPYQFKYFTK